MKLIDKDALIVEIDRQKIGYNLDGKHSVEYDITRKILNIIDTIEVKEVDLDFQRFAKEMDVVFALPSSETKNTEENPLNWEYAIAKHFFELGLKVVQNNG